MQGVVGRLPGECLQSVGVLGRAATFHAGELPAGVSVLRRIRRPRSGPVAVGDVNGKEVGLEVARERTRSLGYGSLVVSRPIKVVNELDRCSKDAQDLLLTYLDRMKPGQAFLGTTNLDLGSLTERFQTRFQSVRLQAPENEVLAAFLMRRWSAPITITRQIAEGSQGNVRAALADLEMWMG